MLPLLTLVQITRQLRVMADTITLLMDAQSILVSKENGINHV
jgi:hypothetical protein